MLFAAGPMHQMPNGQISLDTLKTALGQEGLVATSGAVAHYNPARLWCDYTPGVKNADYFNVEPYLEVQVPNSPQETDQQSSEFRLRPDEAVVLVGLTPPPAKYFSYIPYLDWKRYPDGSRKRPIATLGDSVSVATVKSVGPTPFNAPIALIFTPDKTTDAGIRAALRRTGYAAAIIDTVVFPASMLNLGLDQSADQLTIALRTAIWDDPSGAGKNYIDNPPLQVLRVTPSKPAPANPFPAPALRIRGTSHTEMDLMNKVDDLRQGIIAANPDFTAKDIQTMPMCYEGYDLIQRRIEMCGDSRDAFYVGAGLPEFDTLEIRLGDGEFLMIYGVNHVLTGKATYMSTNVYASEIAKLTLGAVDDSNFKDTAKPFLPAGDPAADKMYAYKVSRNCGGEPNCLPLAVPDDCERLVLDPSTMLGVFTRMYIEPATKIGPAMQEIIYDRILKFSPRHP